MRSLTEKKSKKVEADTHQHILLLFYKGKTLIPVPCFSLSIRPDTKLYSDLNKLIFNLLGVSPDRNIILRSPVDGPGKNQRYPFI